MGKEPKPVETGSEPPVSTKILEHPTRFSMAQVVSGKEGELAFEGELLPSQRTWAPDGLLKEED